MQVLAPELLWYELTSILAKRRKRRDLTEEGAAEALTVLLALDVKTLGGPGLHRKALGLATMLDHDVAYDEHYLCVAEEAGCPLWTSDGGMNSAAKRIGVEVHLIS